MKRLFILILFMACLYSQAQTVISANPNRPNILVSNLSINGIGGADTTLRFRIEGGCRAYSILILQTDTIETVATSAWLYGSNDGGSKVQIGDTVILAKDAATQQDYITGTTFPYYIGHLRIPKYTCADGNITVSLFFYP